MKVRKVLQALLDAFKQQIEVNDLFAEHIAELLVRIEVLEAELKGKNDGAI